MKHENEQTIETMVAEMLDKHPVDGPPMAPPNRIVGEGFWESSEEKESRLRSLAYMRYLTMRSHIRRAAR